MFPSILRLASCRRSSSSGARGPSRCSNASVALERFSNSVRHLFRSSKRKVQGLSGGSRFGASSESLLHNCAYIELYFGSSRAFSKICNTQRTYVTLFSQKAKLLVRSIFDRSVEIPPQKEAMIYAVTLPDLFRSETTYEFNHDKDIQLNAKNYNKHSQHKINTWEYTVNCSHFQCRVSTAKNLSSFGAYTRTQKEGLIHSFLHESG